MAFLDRFRLPSNTEANSSPDPLNQILGTTPPEPPIDQQGPPPVHQLPAGASGRANFYGLPEPDELNRLLIGPEGLRRFDEMYRTDPHIRRLILMAWAPIVGGTWGVEPYGGDQAADLDRQVADVVWWMLTKFMSPNWIEHLATLGPLVLRSGFTPFEQIWATCEYEGKTYQAPRKLDVRLPRSVWKWFQDDFGELTHIGQILPSRTDVIIEARNLVYYRLAPEGDNWVGTSLLRHAYKPWYLKDRLERIAAVGEEHKAVGVPIVYPPKGADPQTKAQVERIFANLHTSEVNYVMMPGPKAGSMGSAGVPQDEWLVDVIQFDSSSGASIYEFLSYCQRAIESSFAQDFMALGQHQVGARATAEVQEDPYLAAVDALVTTVVVPEAQRLINRIVQVNWGDKVKGPPELTCSLAESASLSEIATYVQTLAAADALTPDPELEDWLREHADLPPANKEYRDARTKAQLAGFEQAAQPPQPPMAADAQNPDAPPKQQDGPPPRPKKPAPAGKQLAQAEPTARWFESLLSQNRLREAFDGCRQHIEDACGPTTLKLAREMAYRAGNAGSATGADTGPLADVLTAHYEDMYRLGGQTVADELAKQRQALGRRLDSAGDVAGGAAGSRIARARQRGEHSAQNIVNKIGEVLGRQQISGLQNRSTLQTMAEQAAMGALRMEALANTTAMVNDGRNDTGLQATDVVGAYYTSVMDERTCLAPWTTVQTARGPVRAADVTLDDGLLTHTGRYVRPSRIIPSDIEGELLTIHAGGSAPMMTADHPVLVATVDGFAWREAGQLTVGDLVVSEATLQSRPELLGVDLLLSESPYIQSSADEVRSLAPVHVRTLSVPVGAVGLDDEIRDLKVHDPRADLGLCASGETQAFKFEADAPLNGGFAVTGAIAAEGAVPARAFRTRHDSEALAALRAVDQDRRTATGLATEPPSVAAEPVPERLAASRAQKCLAAMEQTALPRAVGEAVSVGDRHGELALATNAHLCHGVASALSRAVDGAAFDSIGERLAAPLARHGWILRGGGEAAAATVRADDAPHELLLAGNAPAPLRHTRFAANGPRVDPLAAVDTPRLHDSIVLAPVDAITRTPYSGQVYDFTIPGDHTMWAEGLLVHNCGPCESADDGELLSPSDAVALGPPNPNCDGQDRCRCCLVWVLSSDPAAIAAVT